MRAVARCRQERDIQSLQEELRNCNALLERERGRLAALQSQKSGGDEVGHDNSDGDVEEKRRLISANTALRKRLAQLRLKGKEILLFPEVADLRNKTVAVLKEVRDINTEIKSLTITNDNLHVALREVQADERARDSLRSKQYREQQDLRDRQRELTDEWRQLERRDVQLHERCASLQQSVLFNMPEKEVVALKNEREQQEAVIKRLRDRHNYLKSLQYGLLDREKLAETKEGKAKLQAESEIEELRRLLRMRQQEFEDLKELYPCLTQ
uniref:Uncharacterized protein TCIL3000_11_8310 n=1 Tax=Trypanosoma congolense (strain IL3000) TaxID=1068625 RepID=G0V162_TRYCI|nr:unnamed protein product [Trypanosoma congolense IL3000]